MKKRTVIYLGLLIFASTTAFGQIKFGLRAGINNAGKINDFNDGGVIINYTKGRVGYHFGLTSKIKVLNIFVQPELLFSTSSNNIEVSSFSNTVAESGKQKYNKMDIPILAGVQFGVLEIKAGPLFTTVLSSKSDLLDKYEMEQNFQKATMGYQIGGGVELGRLEIGLRYEGNLSKLGSGMKVAGQTYKFDTRPNQFLISAAYFF